MAKAQQLPTVNQVKRVPTFCDCVGIIERMEDVLAYSGDVTLWVREREHEEGVGGANMGWQQQTRPGRVHTFAAKVKVNAWGHR